MHSIATCSGLSWLLMTATLSAQTQQPPLTPDQQHQAKAQIRQTLFAPDPLPRLAAETHGSFEPLPGVAAHRVSYATAYGLRVPAILYLPKQHQGKLPAIVIVNGHGGDKYSWYAFYSGLLYAQAGVAVLTFDPIGEGERNSDRKSGTRAHDKLQEPREMGCRLGGLLVTDVMQAVSYLRSRPEVDPARIAACGYSLGSFVLSLAGAVDERLHACVLVGGGNLDGPGEYWDKSKPMCQAIPYQSLAFLGDRAAVIYALHAARGPTLIFNGAADTVVAMPTHGETFFHDLRRRTAAMAGPDATVFDFRFVPDISHRPLFVTKDVAMWLEEKLDFPNWTIADLQAMPTTHISAWAAANNVAMDRGYIAEDREGGTPALGRNYPGLTRQQLSVFTPEEWSERKDTLTYESWVAKARQTLQGSSPVQ